MRKEPAIIIGAIIGVIEAIVAGLSVTEVITVASGDQVLIIVGAVIALAQGLWTRSKVYAPDTVAALTKRPAA